MNTRRVPPLALALLRHFGGRYSESLQGDLLEEFAAGRSAFWCWGQTAGALFVYARAVVQQRLVACIAVALFFMAALWSIAPATTPVVSWARSQAPLHLLIQFGWLAGVPLLLGGLAGAAGHSRRIGAVLLGAGIAYMTPIATPFDSAVCDLCMGPGAAVIPDAIQWATPFGSALLAGLGAWIAATIPHRPESLT